MHKVIKQFQDRTRTKWDITLKNIFLSNSVKIVKLNRIFAVGSFIWNKMRLQYFLYSVKKGNKCRFVRHPGSKSPRRKISSHAYFWKCQGDASPWRSRQPRDWCHTTIPRDNPGYPGAGTHVLCTFRLFSSLYVCVHRRVLSHICVLHTEKCRTSGKPSERPRRRLYDGCVGFDVT